MYAQQEKYRFGELDGIHEDHEISFDKRVSNVSHPRCQRHIGEREGELQNWCPPGRVALLGQESNTNNQQSTMRCRRGLIETGLLSANKKPLGIMMAMHGQTAQYELASHHHVTQKACERLIKATMDSLTQRDSCR